MDAEPAAALTCAACGTRIAAGTALTSPPERPLKPDDPEAKLPPSEPAGAAPLPPGRPTMSDEARTRWAVIFAAVLLAIAVLALAIGRPLLHRLNTPTPTPTATK